jgi:hypothetical protein
MARGSLGPLLDPDFFWFCGKPKAITGTHHGTSLAEKMLEKKGKYSYDFS